MFLTRIIDSPKTRLFTSPYEVWVVSRLATIRFISTACFRPLAGYGLFLLHPCGVWCAGRVYVPWRGVGCFQRPGTACASRYVYVPSRGVGCFFKDADVIIMMDPFTSPRGVWIASRSIFARSTAIKMLSSPGGVWIVSAKVHSPSSCSAGKPSLFANYNIERTFLQGEAQLRHR